jgi:hypothetical protein
VTHAGLTACLEVGEKLIGVLPARQKTFSAPSLKKRMLLVVKQHFEDQKGLVFRQHPRKTTPLSKARGYYGFVFIESTADLEVFNIPSHPLLTIYVLYL